MVFTWLVMLLLGIGSWLVTHHLSMELKLSRWQNLLEVLVLNLQEQIKETSGQTSNRYLPFVGTLFIFIESVAIYCFVISLILLFANQF